MHRLADAVCRRHLLHARLHLVWTDGRQQGLSRALPGLLLCLLQVASLSAGCRKHRESILRPEAFKVFTRKPYTPKPSLITRTKPNVPVR